MLLFFSISPNFVDWLLIRHHQWEEWQLNQLSYPNILPKMNYDWMSVAFLLFSKRYMKMTSWKEPNNKLKLWLCDLKSCGWNKVFHWANLFIFIVKFNKKKQLQVVCYSKKVKGNIWKHRRKVCCYYVLGNGSMMLLWVRKCMYVAIMLFSTICKVLSSFL